MRIIFNSSMPRACSTLFQNILNQHPDIYATPTDGVLELLNGAKKGFESVEFKAHTNQEEAKKNYNEFCKGGLLYYANSLSDKKNIVIKSRGAKKEVEWLSSILGKNIPIIVLIRNLKDIVASFEKLYRKNPDKISQWYIQEELRGTTTVKRVDMYLKNIPLGLDLDRINEVIEFKLQHNFLFVRAEDLTSRPQEIMSEVYNNLNLKDYKHDFNNIEQTTQENDTWHGLDDNLHTIRKKVQPLVSDAEAILGKDVCDYIDKEYSWYQKFFNYIS